MMANNTSSVDKMNSSNLSEALGGTDESESEREARKYLWVIYGSILMIVGTVGNVMAVAVLIRPNMRRSNAARYLMVLAVSDIGVLYTGMLRHIIMLHTGKDIRMESEVACKIHITLMYFFQHFSSWILSALTLERLFSVCWPHRVRNMCTHRTSACIIVGIAVGLFAFNMHHLVFFGYKTAYQRTFCIILTRDYYMFYSFTWPWLEFCVFSLIPLTVQIVCNTVIVNRVIRSFQESRREAGGFSGGVVLSTSDNTRAHGKVAGDSSAIGQSWKSLEPPSAAGRGGGGGGSGEGSGRRRDHQVSREAVSHDRTQARIAAFNNNTNLVVGDGDPCDQPEADTAMILTDKRLILTAHPSAGTARTLPSSPSHPPTSPLLDMPSPQQHQQPAFLASSAASTAGVSSITNNIDATTAGDFSASTDVLTAARSSRDLSQNPNPEQELAFTRQHHHHQQQQHRHHPHHRHAGSWNPEVSGAGGGAGGRVTGGGASGRSRDGSRVSSMTSMLVTVSMVFCLTTLPVSMFFIINWININRGNYAPHREIVWAVLNLLMYTNNAVNFILYSLSGSRFRAELFTMTRALRECLPRPLRVRRSGSAMVVTSRTMTTTLSHPADKAKAGAAGGGRWTGGVEARRWTSKGITEMRSYDSQESRSCGGRPLSASSTVTAEEEA